MPQPVSASRVRIGTRRSPLALVQAEQTAAALTKAAGGALSCEIVTFTTSGDQLTTERLINAGGKGLFTKEIDRALDAGEIDIAVHSLKDVPSALPPGQSLVALPERADPREGFLSPHGKTLDDLPQGAMLGTASLRREAQSLHRRPDLKPVPFRGNVQTRLRKLEAGEADATFLAMAGLTRLGLAHLAHPLPLDTMLPAPCQGIITVAAVEERLSAPLRDALATYDHAPTRAAATIERAFLTALDGSCRTPIAGHAEPNGSGGFHFRGEVLSPDGKEKWVAEAIASNEPTALADAGHRTANEIRTAAGGALPQFADL